PDTRFADSGGARCIFTDNLRIMGQIPLPFGGTAMAIGARLETRDSADLRGAPRRLLHLEVTAAKPSGQSVQALVHNISETGLLLETSTSLEIGDEVTILLPRKAETSALVIWASDGLYGCKFSEPLTRAVLSAAQLQSAPRPTGEFSRLLSRADDAE